MRLAWLLIAAVQLGSATQTHITALEQVTAVLSELKTNSQTAYETNSRNLGRLEEISATMVNGLNTTLEGTKVELTASEAAVQQYQVELDELTADVEAANAAIIDLEGQKEAEITNAAEAEKEYAVGLAEYEAGEQAVANAIQYLQAEKDAQEKNPIGLVAAHKRVKKAVANLTNARVVRLLQQMPTVATRGSNWEKDEHLFDDIDVEGLNRGYTFRSGSVLEALGGVQTSLAGEKESLIGAEVTRKENYQGMLSSLSEQITTTRTTYNTAVANRATKETQYAEEEINRKNLAATVEADTAFLARTIEQFDNEKADYKEKAAMAKGEADAIDQALVAMAGVSGLGLVGVRSRLTIAGSPDDTASEVERVGSFLRTSAKRVDSSALSRIADKAFEAAAAGDDDPLAEVKAMIEKLVMDLKAQEIKDTEQKAYCDEELAKNEHDRKTATTSVEKFSGTLAALEGEQGEKMITHEEKTAQLALRQEERRNRTTDRLAEKEANNVTITEARAAESAVNAAIDILKAFYANTTMFAEPPPQSDHVVGLLTVIRDDYTSSVNKTEVAEKKAAKLFNEADTESRVAITILEKDLEEAHTRLNVLNETIPGTNESLNASQTELVSAEAMYEQLHALCLAPESYEDRKAKRDNEIAALQQSLEMFDQMAAPVVLVQGANATAPAAVTGPKVSSLTMLARATQNATGRFASEKQNLDATLANLFGLHSAVSKTQANAGSKALTKDDWSQAIARVTAILESVRADVMADAAVDEQTHQDMQSWCTVNLGAARSYTGDAQDRDEQLTLLIESKTHSVAVLEVETAKLEEEIASARKAVATAENLRKQEHESFNEETKSLIESITALQGALVVLSGHQPPKGSGYNASTYGAIESNYSSTLSLSSQDARLKKKIDPYAAVLAGVQKVFKTYPAAVSAVQAKEVLRALEEQPTEEAPPTEAAPTTETTAPTEAELEALRTPESYTSPTGEWREMPESMTRPKSSSGVVFGILNDMLETFQSDLNVTQVKEAEAQAAYEELMESKQTEIDTMLENHQSKSLNLANDRVTLASSKEELEDLRVSLSASYRLVQEITTQCNDFDLAYAERKATRESELEALNTTITRLSSPAAAAILAGNTSNASAAATTTAATLIIHARRPQTTSATSPTAKPQTAQPTAPAAPQAVLGDFLKRFGHHGAGQEAINAAQSVLHSTIAEAKAKKEKAAAANATKRHYEPSAEVMRAIESGDIAGAARMLPESPVVTPKRAEPELPAPALPTAAAPAPSEEATASAWPFEAAAAPVTVETGAPAELPSEAPAAALPARKLPPALRSRDPAALWSGSPIRGDAASLVQKVTDLRIAQTPGLTSEVLGAVIAQVDPLVTVLVEEKLEESRMHDLCIGEISSAGLRIEEKNTSLEELNRQKTQVELSMTQTAAEIASAESEIASLSTSLNLTAAERQRQHAKYREQVQDQEAVMGLLQDAINIMNSFYNSPAAALLQLIQPKEEAPPTEAAPTTTLAPASANGTTSESANATTSAPLTAPTLNGTAPTFAPTKAHGSSQGVVSILEILYEEAEATIQQVVDAEEASQDAYLAEVNSLQQSKVLKNKELVTLRANHGQQTLRLSELEGSIETVTTEMSDLNTYLVTVHAKCDLLIQYFSQNQAARDSEIQALRDAKAFLAGKVQTGGISFLQHRSRA